MTALPTSESRRRVVLASHNPGKLREFAALLAPAGIELVAQGELDVDPAEEPYFTFVENALTKARHASRLTAATACGCLRSSTSERLLRESICQG